MNRINIKPSWVFTNEHGDRIDPHLFALLRAISDTHKLTHAAKIVGLSYRHSWDLLTQWSQFFGSPLVTRERGKGTRLTTLGEKLVWAEQRTDARLFPQLENIASELNLEIAKAQQQTLPLIRTHASHGFAVAQLPTLLREQKDIRMDLQYMVSTQAIASLERDACDCAGFHIPEGMIGKQIATRYSALLQSKNFYLIRLVMRTQGLIVASRNPHQVTSLSDLTSGLRFINRQPDSGTRVLLNTLLEKAHIQSSDIQGYDNHEYTHAAVAAYIASGMADAGFGVEAAARQFHLDFIPIIREHYLFACKKNVLKKNTFQQMIDLLHSEAFAATIATLPGYSCDQPGEIISFKAFVDAL